MIRARVNGVDCVIYSYDKVNDYTICHVKYKEFDFLFPVIAELIEVSYE